MINKARYIVCLIAIAVMLIGNIQLSYSQNDNETSPTEIIYVSDTDGDLLLSEIKKLIEGEKLDADVIIEKPEKTIVGHTSDEVYNYDLEWNYEIKADSVYRENLFGNFRKESLGYYTEVSSGVIETLQLTDSEKNSFNFSRYRVNNFDYNTVNTSKYVGYGRNEKEVKLIKDDISFDIYKDNKYLKTVTDEVLTSQKTNDFSEIVDNVDRSSEINRDKLFEGRNSGINTTSGSRNLYDSNGINALAISNIKLERFDFYYSYISGRRATISSQLIKKTK